MPVSPARVFAVTLYVENPERSKAFYEKVFGLAAVFEDADSATFTFENLLVNVLRRSQADELIEPAAVAPPESGSHVLLTVGVDDADAACAELARAGVTLLNGPVDRDWGMRTAAFADPDGHVWEIGQRLG